MAAHAPAAERLMLHQNAVEQPAVVLTQALLALLGLLDYAARARPSGTIGQALSTRS